MKRETKWKLGLSTLFLGLVMLYSYLCYIFYSIGDWSGALLLGQLAVTMVCILLILHIYGIKVG